MVVIPRSSSPRLNSAERRALIERAATELFAHKGYATTTVDEIVAAAGVTKPMLYRHFESKQELCIKLLERYRDAAVAAPLAKFDPHVGSARAQLAGMIRAWLDHAREHPDETRLLFTPIKGDPEVERVQADLFRRQRATQIALLRELTPDLDDRDAEPMGELTRLSLPALGLWWIEHPDTPVDTLVDILSRMVDGLIGAARDRPRRSGGARERG